MTFRKGGRVSNSDWQASYGAAQLDAKPAGLSERGRARKARRENRSKLAWDGATRGTASNQTLDFVANISTPPYI